MSNCGNRNCSNRLRYIISKAPFPFPLSQIGKSTLPSCQSLEQSYIQPNTCQQR